MDRKEVLEKLTALAPALATNELVPQLTRFWFDGNSITATNDRISISTPFKTGFKGGLSGQTLLGLVRNSRNKDIIIADRDSEVEIKATGELAHLALLFNGHPDPLPKPTGKKFGVKGHDLIAALKRCLLTTTDDTSVPDQLGVTFIPDGNRTRLYSTNGNLITESIVSAKLGKRAILSAEFCQQLVNLAPDDKEALDLEITDSYALLTMKAFTLYGRLIEAERPLPFGDMFDMHFPEEVDDYLIPVPDVLKTAVERSLVMAASSDGDAKIKLIVKDGELKLVTQSTVGKSVLGTIHDTVKLGKSKHPNVEAIMSPKSLKAGIDIYELMAITERCVILHTEKGGTLLAATTNN